MAVADRLASALDRRPDARHDALMWEGRSLDAAVRLAIQDADPPWQDTGLGSRFTRTDGTGGIHLPFPAPQSAANVPSAVVWGGPRGYEHLHWKAEFTADCPNSLVVAALSQVIEPQTADRLFGQVPAANRAQALIAPRPDRPAAATAHGHHRPGGGAQPAHPAGGSAPASGERRHR